MIRFFRSQQPAVLFLIPLIAILLWLPCWNSLTIYSETGKAPLWDLVFPALIKLPGWMVALLSFGISTFSAIYFNLLLNKFEVIFKNSYLPSLFYVLLLSSSSFFIAAHPLQLVNLFLLFYINDFFYCYKQPKPYGRLFNAGFYISICCLFWLPLIPIAICSFFIFMILRSFNLKELLLLLTGFLVPFYLFSVWLFPTALMNELLWIGSYISHYQLQLIMEFTLQSKLLIGLIGFFLIISIIRLRTNYYKNVIRTRLYQQIIFLLTFFLMICILLSGQLNWMPLMLMVIPASFFCSYFFLSVKKYNWLYETLFLLFISLLIFNRL